MAHIGDDCGWWEYDEHSQALIARPAPAPYPGTHWFESIDGQTAPAVRWPIGFMRRKPIVRVKAGRP
jgi:hypothetical protein